MRRPPPRPTLAAAIFIAVASAGVLAAPGASRAAWATAAASLPTVAAPARIGAAAPLPYIEVRTAGAAPDAELPLVVALHGRGDTPEAFAALFDGLGAPARVAVLRPPHAWGGGFAWFLGARAIPDSRAKIVGELSAEADQVAATVEAIRASRPTRGAPIVMGFSQGAMLAWACAVRHPETFAAAFPVSGFLFPEILARARVDRARFPTTVAFHGAADPLVKLDWDQRGVQLLEQQGVHAELRVYDGVPHALAPKIRADLFDAMTRALAQTQAQAQAQAHANASAHVNANGRAKTPAGAHAPPGDTNAH